MFDLNEELLDKARNKVRARNKAIVNDIAYEENRKTVIQEEIYDDIPDYVKKEQNYE